MIRELYQTKIRETALNVSMNRIDAVRHKEITKSGCRVYSGGLIGISGRLGEPTAETWEAAKANLALKVPYPFDPEEDQTRIRDLREVSLTDPEFIRLAEAVLDELRSGYPDFIFSNKISMTETEVRLRNDKGLDFLNLDRTFNIGLLVKHKDSVNVFDTGVMRQDRVFDRAALLRDAEAMLGAFTVAKPLPARKTMLVVTEPDLLLGKMQESLNGEAIARAASLFCGKIGTEVFSPTFSLWQDRSKEQMHVPFFDTEGIRTKQDICPLIENGVILRAFTDKRNAALLGFPSTGAAAGAYDDVPSLGGVPLTIAPSDRTLRELLAGEEAMLVVIASGGDYTGPGDYASPIQMALLTDGEKTLGRLPECNVRGNLFSLFGSDFVGISSDKPLSGNRALVVRMTVDG